MFKGIERCIAPREHHLFVYGTLMTGQANHAWMEQLIERDCAELVSHDAVAKDMGILDVGGLPALYSLPTRLVSQIANLDQRATLTARGEVYRISVEGLEFLDELEGHPHFYRRQFSLIRIPPERKSHQALMYKGPLPKLRFIPAKESIHVGDLLHAPSRSGLQSDFRGQNARTPIYISSAGNWTIQPQERIA